jgi:predicted small lipoprotein YifL
MRRVASAVALLVLLLAALAGCGSKDITPPIGAIDQAKDASARTQIMVVKTGIASYIATSGTVPAAATQQVLGSFVNPWPRNPWTQAPMVPGDQPGDMVYTPGAGVSYTLGVHLSDGSVFTAP